MVEETATQEINTTFNKTKTHSLVFISMLVFMVSISLCWDNDYTNVGFFLSTFALVVTFLYDAKQNLRGFVAVLMSGYFWWVLAIIFLILFSIDNVTPENRFIQYVKIIMILETIFTFGISLFTLNRWNRKVFIDLCIACSLILCSWVLVNEFQDIINIRTDSRIGWSAGGSNPNYVGVLLGYFSTVIFYEYYKNKKKSFFVLLLVQYCFMFMTGSKKIIIAIVVPIMVLTLLKSKKKNRLSYFVILLIILIFLSLLVMKVKVLHDLMGVRIERTLMALGIMGYQADNSTTTRLHFMFEALVHWLKKPFFGYGYQAFNYILGFGTYSHINYLEMLVSFGLFGFLIYYGIYILLLFKLFQIRKINSDADLFIMLLILQLVLDVAMVSYYDFMLFYVTIIAGWYFCKKSKKVKLF